MRQGGISQGDGHPRRVVRLGVQPRRRAGDASRAALARRDVPRGLGPAPRVVPLLAPRGDAYRRIRNTFRFLLGTLADFDPDHDRVSYDQMDEIDRWALMRLGELIARVRRAYEEYQFHVVFHTAHNFCAVDLSALYLDIIKDRLYTRAPDDPGRRASQTVCFEMLTALTRLLAPILTFTAEEVWSYIPGRGKPESVHLMTFPEERGEWLDERLGTDWDRLLEVRGEVSRALESARKQGLIGKGVDAVLYVVSAPEEQWRPLLA